MSAVENPTVASGAAHIEDEPDADLGGEHHLSVGSGVPDVVNTNATQATNTVSNEVPKAETPGGEEQTREETGSDHADNSSSANNGFNALAKKTHDDRSKGIGKVTDRSFDSDSDGDSYDHSDSESGVDSFTRFQPRGPPVKSSSGKPPPADAGLNDQPKAQSKTQAQNPKTDNKPGKPK